MKVRFARWLPGVFFGLGVVLVVVAVALLRDEPGGLYPVLAVAVVSVLFGVLYLRAPYIVLTDATIRVFDVSRLTTVQLRARDRIVAEGNRLVIRRGGRIERLPAYRWYANPADWGRLLSRPVDE